MRALRMRWIPLAITAAVGCRSAPTPGRDQVPPVVRIEMEPMRIDVVRGGAAPEFEIFDAGSLFDEAGDLLEARDFDGALARYDRLIEEFPQSRFVSAALYNSGLAWEGKGDFSAAAERYQALWDRFPDTRDGQDGLFRLGGVYAELEQWEASAATLGKLLDEAELLFADRIEAFARKGLAHYHLEQLDETEATMLEAIAYYKEQAALERLDSMFFVGMIHYYAAAVSHARCQAAPIRLPQAQMAKDFNEKAELLLKAQDEYVATIRLRDPHWATASGYQIGLLFTQFRQALLAAPIPPELKTDLEREVYAEELRKELRVLIEKAVGVYEKTVLMAERAGVRNDWVAKTNEQLDRLRRLLSGDETEPTTPPTIPSPDPRPETVPAPPPVVL